MAKSLSTSPGPRKYEEVRKLGEGSFGTAMLVRDTVTGLEVVKKTIELGNNPEEAEKAVQEAHFLRGLHHPNIVSYVDGFVEGSQLVIVMEYADGGDLAGYIGKFKKKNMPIDENNILYVMLGIGYGLEALHNKYMMHRDLKPGNVFLTRQGFVKLGDLGVARQLQNTDDFSGTFIGTPFYMSPEVCLDKGYSRPSDIWAFGCIIHEMCTLERTFPGEIIFRVVQAIQKGEYAPVPGQYSQGLRDAITSMLQMNPDDRPKVSDVVQLPLLSGARSAYRSGLKKLQSRSNSTLQDSAASSKSDNSADGRVDPSSVVRRPSKAASSSSDRTIDIVTTRKDGSVSLSGEMSPVRSTAIDSVATSPSTGSTGASLTAAERMAALMERKKQKQRLKASGQSSPSAEASKDAVRDAAADTTTSMGSDFALSAKQEASASNTVRHREKSGTFALPKHEAHANDANGGTVKHQGSSSPGGKTGGTVDTTNDDLARRRAEFMARKKRETACKSAASK